MFLDRHRIGAVGQGPAREDAHGLSRFQRSGEGAAGRRLADKAKPRGNARHVVGPDGIAVHGRDRGGRLRDPGRDVLCKDAPMRDGQRDLFGGQGLEASENAQARFRHGDHDGARQVPDLPPAFSTSRTASMTMPLSTALSMS